MKQKGLIFSCLMVFCLVVGVFSANAQTSAFQMGLEATTDGSTVSNEFAVGTATTPTYLYLNILLDAEESGVAACAFTLKYDSTRLEAPPTTTDGLPTTATDITSSFPFTTTVGTETTKTHRVNSTTTPGEILFSGAEITSEGGSKTHNWDAPLFTVRFKVKETAPAGNAVFSLEQTILTNPAAGWNGEGVHILVGAVPKTDSRFGGDLSDDFPVLLENFSATNPAPSLTVAIVGGTVTPYEAKRQALIAEGKADIGGETEDYDRDGYSNYDELMVNNTNPYLKNAATEFPAIYDELLDNRVTNLDVDDSGRVSVAVDGALIARYVAGKRLTGLIDKIPFTADSTRTDATEIATYIKKMFDTNLLDVDGSGKPSLATDGVIIKRYMTGKRLDGLIQGLDTTGCTRCTGAEVQAWIRMLFPDTNP